MLVQRQENEESVPSLHSGIELCLLTWITVLQIKFLELELSVVSTKYPADSGRRGLLVHYQWLEYVLLHSSRFHGSQSRLHSLGGGSMPSILRCQRDCHL